MKRGAWGIQTRHWGQLAAATPQTGRLQQQTFILSQWGILGSPRSRSLLIQFLMTAQFQLSEGSVLAESSLGGDKVSSWVLLLEGH